MNTLHARFAELHNTSTLLVLPNAWDAGSARLAQEQGAQAVGTTSAAMAWSCGYADGSALPRTPTRSPRSVLRSRVARCSSTHAPMCTCAGLPKGRPPLP